MATLPFIEDAFRLSIMRLVLSPAAYLLPRTWALAIAKAMAFFFAVSPKSGVEVYWQMRQAFGKPRLESFTLSWGWLALPFHDYVVSKRLFYGRENVKDWKVVEKNGDAIKSPEGIRRAVHFGGCPLRP